MSVKENAGDHLAATPVWILTSMNLLNTLSLQRTVLIIFLLGLAGSVFGGHPASVTAKIYSVGVVPQFEQRQLVHIWRPLLDELEHRTGLKFRLAGTPRISSFEKKVELGEFDFVYMNAYMVSKSQHDQKYIPLIMDGGRAMKGIVVVHKDSPIKDIKELNGQEMVFPAPNAFGASMVVRRELQELHGVTIKPIYAQTHSSVYLHIAKKLAIAGGGVARTLHEQDAHIKNNLRILYTTQPLPPHPISAQERIPEQIREKVKNALLEMGQTEEGRHLLAAIPMKSPVAASVKDYSPLMAADFRNYAEPATDW